MRFPPIPEKQNVCLETGYEVTVLVGTSFSETINELTSPNPVNPPKFLAAMFTMYRNAFLAGLDFSIEIVNMGTNPVAAVMAQSNSTDSVASSFDAVAQTKGSIYRVIGVTGDGSRTLMRHKYTAGGVLGTPNKADHATWFSPISTPSYVNRPQLIYGFKCFGTIVGPTTTLLLRVKVKYHIEFFTLANDVTNLNEAASDDDFQRYNEQEGDTSLERKHVIYDAPHSLKHPLVPLRFSKKLK